MPGNSSGKGVPRTGVPPFSASSIDSSFRDFVSISLFILILCSSLFLASVLPEAARAAQQMDLFGQFFYVQVSNQETGSRPVPIRLIAILSVQTSLCVLLHNNIECRRRIVFVSR